MFIVKKKIKGRDYFYIRKSVRDGGKVASKNVAYGGKTRDDAERKMGAIMSGGERIKNKEKQETSMEEKKVYLIHGWGESSKYKLFQWIKRELKGQAKVYSFDMPNTDNPKIEEWVGFLQENIKSLDENTYFIGHSIGCQTILRFLEQLNENIRIGGCAFIAGWFNLSNLKKEEEKIAEPWLKTKIDFDKIKKHCNNFLAVFSDDDSLVPLSNEKIFKEKLGARTIIKENQGHFDETEKLSEIADCISGEKNMAKEKTEKNKNLTIDELASFCKRKGFVFKSSEIYGGFSGFWDYGPLGAELFNNIKQDFWKFFVHGKENMTGIDASIISHPKTWEASGHVSSFSDVAVVCKKCKKATKIDKREIDKVKCECGGEYNVLGEFSLLFKTDIGALNPTEAYLRGETAQGMFLNFKNIIDTGRAKLPFGILQVGKCFRNEIAPRDFLFRDREFTIGEFEFFIHPEDDNCDLLDDEHLNLRLKLLDAQEQEKVVLSGKEPKHIGIKETTIGRMIKEKRLGNWHAYWLAEQMLWFKKLGILPGIKIREHMKSELSHYSSATFDLDYEYPFGSMEIAGNANRGQYDLKQHEKFSGEKMEIFDEKTKSKIIPRVIEPTFGIDRIFLAVLCRAYHFDEKRQNIVLKLPAYLSPVKAAVFPIVKGEEFENLARSIYLDLKKEWNVAYDASGSLGRRYSRQDEIGTIFCITIDGDSVKDKDCTIRNRDTTEQIRVKIAELKDILRKLIAGEIEFDRAGKKTETRVK